MKGRDGALCLLQAVLPQLLLDFIKKMPLICMDTAYAGAARGWFNLLQLVRKLNEAVSPIVSDNSFFFHREISQTIAAKVKVIFVAKLH